MGLFITFQKEITAMKLASQKKNEVQNLLKIHREDFNTKQGNQ